MRLLLDTHVFLALVELGSVKLNASALEALMDGGNDLFVSVGSLWEIGIKVRLGKLDIGISLGELPILCASASSAILTISAAHVLSEAIPTPPTRDPFDRLLLAQAQVEGMWLGIAVSGHVSVINFFDSQRRRVVSAHS